MNCISCGSSVPSNFKYAIMKNECPCCGKCLLDEESLALIESIENTIKNSVNVREETAHNLAVVLISEYEISANKIMSKKSTPKEEIIIPPKTEEVVVSEKIAPPSIIKQESNVVKAPEVPDNISDAEREKIMEEAVKERYNIVEQSNVVDFDDFGELDDPGGIGSMFSEESDSILERERIKRLSKQQNILNGGGKGAFRRSG